MDFALLGDDADVLPLLRCIAARAEHRLTHIACTQTTLPEAIGLNPASVATSSWEEMLLADSVRAVIVAGDNPEILNGAKRLAAAGKSLLVLCRASQGIAFVYELTLIRDDSNSLLIPLIPHTDHPMVRELRQEVESGRLGTLSHLQLDREVFAQSAGSGLSVEEIDHSLLADVELLRMLAGDYNQVTALRAGNTTDCVTHATVTLAGAGLPESCWTAKSTSAASKWVLTVSGSAQTAHLKSDGTSLILELPRREVETAVDAPVSGQDWGADALQRFEAAARGETMRPDWNDLTRDFEIVEATHRSVTRRRTIDLHFETTSERAIFKSQMTALGCGLLVLTLIGLLGLLTIGALLDNRDPLEANAASAGFIVHSVDFVEDTSQLTSEAKVHVAAIAARMKNVPSSVLVESENRSDSELDKERRRVVATALQQAGAADADRRTIVRRVHGRTTSLLMKVLRVAWSIPLILFLLLQLLIFVTRPTSRR